MTNPIPIQPTDGGDGGTYPPPATTPTPAPGATVPPPPPPASTTPSTPAAPATVQINGATSSIVQGVSTPIPTFAIPLATAPSQVLAVTLGNQPCVINLYTRSTGLYLDLALADTPICTGVICLDRNLIVRAAYLGFQGDLVFIDSQGMSDPTYEGLGTRFNLIWLDF